MPGLGNLPVPLLVLKTQILTSWKRGLTMLSYRTQLPRFFALALLALAWSALPVRAQYGLDLTGAGPVNRSMGGASVAAPLDGVGAIFWNPATTTALPNLEMD